MGLASEDDFVDMGFTHEEVLATFGDDEERASHALRAAPVPRVFEQTTTGLRIANPSDANRLENSMHSSSTPSHRKRTSDSLNREWSGIPRYREYPNYPRSCSSAPSSDSFHSVGIDLFSSPSSPYASPVQASFLPTILCTPHETPRNSALLFDGADLLSSSG